MGGGLMQLVAYGAQDIYLTGNPQITYFKVVYRRHTNFAIESILQTLSGTSSSGNKQNCAISRDGDLIHKIWIGEKYIDYSTGDIYKYIDYVECKIGGSTIDKQTSDWNAIKWELTTPESKVNGLKNTLSGNSGADTSGYYWYPLSFWFCDNIGLSLPLIAMQYHEISLDITWGKDSGVSSPEVWVDYIFLDTDERRKFSQITHEYLIEQIQVETFSGDKSTLDLNFNHPIKELIWVNDVSNNTTNFNIYAPMRCTDNVHTTTSNIAYQNADDMTCKLNLNGHDRFKDRNVKYFKSIQPITYHTRCPAIGKRFIVNCSLPYENLTTGGTLLYYVSKPVRIIKAVLTGTTAAANNTTDYTLIIDNGPSEGASSTITADTYEVSTIGNMNNSVNKRTFDEPDDKYKLCVQEGKHIGIKASATSTIRGFVTFELEELPLLIAGDGTKLANIYCYSFALKPEEHQPSGSCNFSRIDTKQLIFNNAVSGSSSTTTRVFAINYNILRINSGMGGLAYSN